MVVMSSMSWVVDLDDEAARDPGVSGTKAAMLARLRAEGLPAPPGVVLTVAGSRAWAPPAAGGGAPGGEDPGRGVRAALAEAVGRLGGGALAVRSSGMAEDLPGASFAGQYKTVLGVRGIAEVTDAVGRCLESGAGERVNVYSGVKGIAPGGAMAVLIQPLLHADAAGVAFTANPITGDRGEILVSAVRGLGERLVSGQATPDDWTVRDDEVRCVHAPEGAIDAGMAGEIARLAQAVEEAFGGPQDVEWAIEGGKLWLLQARPITALPRPPDLDVPGDGFWAKDDTHYPAPLTPFGASVYVPVLDRAWPAAVAEFGLPIEEVRQRSLAGEVYMRIVPPGGKDRPPPPWWVVALASRLLPSMRRREKAARHAFETNLADQLLECWPHWREESLRQVAALQAVKVRSLEDEALLAHLDAAAELACAGQSLHIRLLMPYVIALYELGTVCADLLGWEPAHALALVAGTSQASSEPGRALAALADTVRRSPEALAAVREGRSDTLDRLRDRAPNAAAAIDDYLGRYGHRPLSYDPGDVTLAERPGLLISLLRDQLHQPARPEPTATGRDGALTEARERLAAASLTDRERFENAFAFASRAYPVRDDNVFVLDNLPSGLIRRAVAEIGRRLAGRGTITTADDAVFLEDRELRAALHGVPENWPGRIGQRKAERAWVLAHPGPASYGPEPGPPPDLRGLPPGLRRLSAVMMWANDVMLASGPPQGAAGEHQLRGIGASPGRYHGRVRVIREEAEFGQLQPGDVLVCPITSPAWSVLFTRAGALVTDGGGILSHAAIVAREYGVPAVVATGDATRRLHNGDPITVDGASGTVVPDLPAG